MKTFVTAAAIALMSAVPALADLVKVESRHSVPATLDALEMALDKAGATVFARVDHAKGAEGIGEELAASQLLIFGNPKIGTAAMQADARAGLFLPLKALAYEDSEGKVWLTYEDPVMMFEGLDIKANAEFIAGMTAALQKLSEAATQ
ncbi:DUF302 domain-containing protein [Tritonibacter mobilis]|uniref:DUF302 domain-containing protein n=1 Tax=Tritonibacter mobilis TaxID=379347 RepID=UPI000806D0D7|nr:DUF302 domain-containing protein [Tritonibacter mobilis]NKX37295.1 DUF302 domain-containing protein [Rhodobacteraceae bacterium R_SAG4]GLP85616.1 hypothetical protein GCM10007921_11760 [Tritonibacter mobilis]SDW65197.1 Uncharacterized conserved protein, DUF302 family [Tritonibacter mobilis]